MEVWVEEEEEDEEVDEEIKKEINNFKFNLGLFFSVYFIDVEYNFKIFMFIVVRWNFVFYYMNEEFDNSILLSNFILVVCKKEKKFVFIEEVCFCIFLYRLF